MLRLGAAEPDRRLHGTFAMGTKHTAFERTIQKSNAWLDELSALLGIDNGRDAYSALRVGLHALRDRLTIEEMADLGAQLPMLLRGMFYEGWHPSAKPERVRHLDDFLDLVRGALPPTSTLDPESVVWAVFRTMSNHIPPGELADIGAILPRELKVFWESSTIDEVRDRSRHHREHTGWHR